ncbi:ABCB family ABC transporter ATP-binding protein/permease [Rhizorhapis suberifaciens]|nr:ABC transporter ATP-binding protein/permease [Rhizorhapis suberifaciens]
MPPEPIADNQLVPPVLATLKRFLIYLWPADAPALRRRVVVALLFVVLGKAAGLVMPFAYKGAIDRMAPGLQPAVGLAIALVIAYAGARFTSVLFENIRNVAFERVGQEATRRLTEHVFGHLHQLSLRFHLNRKTGAVTKIIERGTKSIDVMLYFLLFNIAPTVLELAAVCVIFFMKFGPGMVGVTLVMVVLYIWYTRVVTEWRTKLRRDMVDLDTTAFAHAVDSLLNFETVKYFNAEKREEARFSSAVRTYADAAVKSENSLALLNIGQGLITNLMMAGAMGYTVWGWSVGKFTTGDVVLVNTLLAQLFRPLDLLGMVYRNIRQGLIDMEAMFQLIDTPTDVVDDPNAPLLQIEAGEVRFENVHFSYGDRKILHGLDFVIPAGRTLAIVGPSGAGKSTIARLLFRFYDVDAGHIQIDGQNIAKVTQSSLRQQIGIVPQDTVLFNDTIGYNIAYGRAGADPEEIETAMRGAAIAGFVHSMPQGLDTRVGERGLKLSGGEKQRVAIARTLLKNPPILILDEATSALDSRTEANIQATLNAIAKRRTTIIIAHRLSTVVDADEIIVLEGGRVAERGTHSDLLARAGLYAAMWMRQAAEREVEEA